MNLVEEALTGHWGPKCSEYEAGCIVCDAWRQYENLVTYGETLSNAPPLDPAIRMAIGKLIEEKDICTINGKKLNAS
jgi:hypothetical protein